MTSPLASPHEQALAAAEPRELREGDIYRWRWADQKKDADCGPYRSYHCKSQIAIVQDGHLHDTYWFGGGSERWINPRDVTLTFWANTADLTEINKHSVIYYRREDVVDLRHSNNSHGPVYLRNGAERDQVTMLKVIENRLDEARREIEWAQRRIEQLTKEADKVRAGNLSEVYL